MRRIRKLLITGVLAVSGFGHAQEDQASQKSLPELIGEIAEKGERQASDYQTVAAATLEIGQQAQQAGQFLPEPAIRDALDAVDVGQEFNPHAADWNSLREDLEKLLEQQQQQQQQQQDQQEQQDGEQQDESEQQKGSESESSQPQESGSEGEQSEDGEPQEGEQSQEQEQEGQQDQGQESDPSEGQGEEAESQEQSGDEQQPSPQDGAQMGELSEPEADKPLELSEPSPEDGDEEQTQQVGGQAGQEQAIDAKNAAIRQMLEQLKQRDDPAKLFQLLQEAQSGEKREQQPNEKDW